MQRRFVNCVFLQLLLVDRRLLHGLVPWASLVSYHTAGKGCLLYAFLSFEKCKPSRMLGLCVTFYTHAIEIPDSIVKHPSCQEPACHF